MPGTVYTVAPIPPDPEHTTYVDAGAIKIGVEYRILDDAELDANYEGADREEIRKALGGQQAEDNGVSLHVVGTADDHEYLRFDMFEREPHYHYIEPSGEKQTILEYDRVASGEMLPWALGQIRTRLTEMLRYAGGAALAAELDTQRIAHCLKEVEELALGAQAELDASSRS